MTKEAEKLADRIKLALQFPDAHSFHLSQDDMALIETALRAAARLSPDAGLVDRIAVARVMADHLWCGAKFDDAYETEQQAFLIAADAIRALLSTRTVAGEPVAADYCETCNEPVVEGQNIITTKTGLVHFPKCPAPSGRDPACPRCGAYVTGHCDTDEKQSRCELPSFVQYEGRDPATIEACAKVADGLAAKQRATNEKYPDHAKAYATWQNAVFVFEEAADAIRALLSTRSVAGEPVAAAIDVLGDPCGWVQLGPEGVTSSLDATPAPSGRDHCLKWQDANGACPYGPPILSGRDPATIEVATRLAHQHMLEAESEWDQGYNAAVEAVVRAIRALAPARPADASALPTERE